MHPHFKTDRAYIIYGLLRRFYFILLFAYPPALLALSLFASLGADNGFIALGFWLPFLIISTLSLPLFMGVLLLGVLIHHLLCIKTGVIGGRIARVSTVLYCLSFVCLVLTVFAAMAYTSNILPLISFVAVCVYCVASALLFVIAHAKLRRETSPEPPVMSSALTSRLTRYKRILTAVVTVLLVLSFLLLPYSTVQYDDGGTVKTEALVYTVMDWHRTHDMNDPDSGVDYSAEVQKKRVYFFPDNQKSYHELWEIKH